MDALNSRKFHIDASELRALFDRLSSVLAKPCLLEKEASTQGEAHALTANGLRAVVEAVQGRQTSVSNQSVAGDPRFTSTIRLLATRLRDTYRARVAAELGQRKIEMLASLLSHPVPDILDVLGKSDEENSHSDLIRWLLDPRKANSIAPAALHALVLRLPRPTVWQGLITSAIQQHALSVRREHAFSLDESREESQGRLDLLISGPGFRLVIENKVSSEEHDNQTELYWRWLERQPGLTGGMILSPVGFLARNKNFRALSYVELLNCLLEGPVRARIEEMEEAVLASYIKTLAAGILRHEFSIIGQPRGET